MQNSAWTVGLLTFDDFQGAYLALRRLLHFVVKLSIISDIIIVIFIMIVIIITIVIVELFEFDFKIALTQELIQTKYIQSQTKLQFMKTLRTSNALNKLFLCFRYCL